jgi:hypothetical protein
MARRNSHISVEFIHSGWLETGNSKLDNLDLPM